MPDEKEYYSKFKKILEQLPGLNQSSILQDIQQFGKYRNLQYWNTKMCFLLMEYFHNSWIFFMRIWAKLYFKWEMFKWSLWE